MQKHSWVTLVQCAGAQPPGKLSYVQQKGHLGQGSHLQGLRELLDVDLMVPDESAGELVDEVLQGSHDVASKEWLILLCFAVVAELLLAGLREQ
jgi:hypothetical protein